MMSLPQVSLKDCVDLLAGFAFKSQYFTESEEDIPLIKGENVSQGHILWEISKRWPASEWEALSKYQLKSGDVIVAMDRPWVPAGLKWAYIRSDNPKSLLVQRCARLRSKSSMLDQGFLRFIIGGQGFENYVKPITTGVNVPHISGKQILDYCFPLPPIAAQQRIAGILSAYDDLIENSQRRIKILEAMARGLYREWFVHFRFPGHENHPLVASALGEIPQGWNIKKLGDMIEFKKGKKPVSVFESEEVGLQRHLLIDALRGGSSQEFVAPGKLISTTPEDTIMVMDGSGSSDIFIGYEGVIGSTLGRYRTQVDVGIGPFWLFLFFSSHHAEIKSKNVGSAIPHANKDFINGMEVVIGPEDVMEAFEAAVEPMFGLIRSLNNKANTLRTTRNLLLPRLLSGQIEIEWEVA